MANKKLVDFDGVLMQRGKGRNAQMEMQRYSLYQTGCQRMALSCQPRITWTIGPWSSKGIGHKRLTSYKMAKSDSRCVERARQTLPWSPDLIKKNSWMGVWGGGLPPGTLSTLGGIASHDD